MSDGTVDLSIEGGVASVTFNRPEARNAMTWAMYEQLQAICGQLRADGAVRVVRFQGAGAEAFVAACREAGLKTLLISGGFTFFSERIRHQLGLDFARANSLGIANGRLTGTLFDRPWGDICDGAEKRRVVLEVCELMGIDTAQAIAVGDGANDLPMMGAAGLSIAFHGKPAVREQAMISIETGGMDRALEVLRS